MKFLYSQVVTIAFNSVPGVGILYNWTVWGDTDPGQTSWKAKAVHSTKIAFTHL